MSSAFVAPCGHGGPTSASSNEQRYLFAAPVSMGKFRRSGYNYNWFLLGVAVLFCRVCTLVHPTAAALLSIAFLVEGIQIR
jgi:hypothetical protein